MTPRSELTATVGDEESGSDAALNRATHHRDEIVSGRSRVEGFDDDDFACEAVQENSELEVHPEDPRLGHVEVPDLVGSSSAL